MSPKLTFEEQVLFEKIAADFERPSALLERSHAWLRPALALCGLVVATMGMVIFIQTLVAAFVCAIGAVTALALLATDHGVRRRANRFVENFVERGAVSRRRNGYRRGFF